MRLQARVGVQIQALSGQEEAQLQVCICDKHWHPGDLGSV